MYHPKAHILLKELLSDLPVKLREDQDFILRLTANFPELYSRFQVLYGQRDDIDFQLTTLVNMLAVSYEGRSEKLRETDLSRTRDEGWHLSEKIAGMTLYLDRFCDNLKSFISKIDYLCELGVNLVHLMPLMKGPEEKNDGGYAVSDYQKIDPRYGTNAELKNVISGLHKKDMYLMMDLVVNHTSDQHKWAKEARKGNKQYQDYYYLFEDRIVPDLFERSLPEIFPENSPENFTYSKEMDRWVMTVFNDYQWDLNYANPEVLIKMIRMLLTQANWGVDIFRLDAVAFLWKQLGTSSQNLPEAHIVLQLFKLCTQIVAPGVALLAEAIVSPDEIVKYFGGSKTHNDECDIAYNATLMALLWDAIATHNAKVLNEGMRSMPPKPAGSTWINYVRCHDDIGLGYEDEAIHNAGYTPYSHRRFIVDFFTGQFEGSFAEGMPFMFNPKNGDARISGSLASLAGLEVSLKTGVKANVKKAVNRIILLHSVVISFGGIPMLYYGDEIATLNDYTFLDDPKRSDDNRWIHRPRIDWEVNSKRKERGTPQHTVFTALKRMLKVRSESPEWADHNNCKILDVENEHLFCFERKSQTDITFVIANFKDRPQRVHKDWLVACLHVGVYWDKYTDKPIQLDEGWLTLDPYQFVWLVNKVKRI
ncbi:alpha-amylase [Fulvivirga sp. M361]|uniref:amylosucrase n=1 Tax=Fulvivirga sp. M361 TaxID=2594266 RepID=UPI00117A36A4|nr:amylosucrase [Fulvivirga sp. M361]TRX59929.1 alpha-amylase [Fulvivirga sp. M361]